MLVIPSVLSSQATTARSQATALCWKITLSSGTALRFTDWPHALQLREDSGATLYTYTPVDGLDASARRRADELESTDKELRGIVSSDAIKTEDLRAGRYDGAQVDEFLVDARTSWAGYIEHSRYFVKSVSYSRGLWTAEVYGIAANLTRAVGDVWSPTCRVSLFSAQCGLLASSFQNTTGQVVEIVRQREVIVVSFSVVGSPNVLWDEDGYGNDGVLIWTSGSNNGLRNEMKTHEKLVGASTTGGTITFHAPCAFDVAVGDRCKLLPGCNKKSGVPTSKYVNDVGHCKTRFNNVVNFQGEPFIPGRDRAFIGIPIR